MSIENNMPTDELLTAFLDGELSPEEIARVEGLLERDDSVAERLEFLSRSTSLPLHEAYASLLTAAPQQELEAMLRAIQPQGKPAKAFVSRRGFLGGVAASLFAGFIADRAFIRVQKILNAKDENSEWRGVVAEYISLYTRDTLAGPTPSADIQIAQLATVDEKLGLSLSLQKIALPGADFKRAEVLEYDDKPLAQLAYLDPETGPLALCIIRSNATAMEPDIEGRKGMNVVYWSNDTHAFMLIGYASLDRMKAMAEKVRVGV
jgi:anti-sigma factor RsiW